MQRSIRKVPREMEEIDARSLHTILIYLLHHRPCQLRPERPKKKPITTHKMRSHPTRKQRPLIRLRQPLQQLLQSDLLDQRPWNRAAHHAPPARPILIQIRPLELCLQVVQRAGQLVRDERARLGPVAPLVLAPYARELGRGVLRDLLLNVLDVGGVEGRGGLAVLEGHEADVFGGGEGETCEDFEGGTRDST